MTSQRKSMSLCLQIILFAIYVVFGLVVCVLWLFDFIVFQKKIYPVISIIIFLFGNSFQCYLLYNSVFKQKIIKLIYVLFYLGSLIAGIAIYVSSFSVNHHFSIWTVASVLTQILFALYGITFILGSNQKRKEEQRQNEENESIQEADRSSVYLYNPELPDDGINSYDNVENDNSLSYSDSDYDLCEKKKFYNYCNKKDESENETTDLCRRFEYPERIDVSEDSIPGVVDSLNPYSSQNLELHGVSMLV